MHVLRVNLADKGIALRPLVHSLAERSPLSALAAGHPKLVAASNTGYFDFRSGAPTQPFINRSNPDVISSVHSEVVGLNSTGVLQSGQVWWAALVTAGSRTHSATSKNETYPPAGIAVYTPMWGSAQVPGQWRSAAVAVVNGVATPEQNSRHGLTIPTNGYLLVGNGDSANSWLSKVTSGTKVSLASSVVTSAAKPFVQAYGVGVEVVETTGVVRGGFTCNSINTKQPARTEIGFSDGGRHMVIAFVTDHPDTSEHGLDEDQMSELMVQLGASQAFAFDGSGSTELLARLTKTGPMTLENYPADGQERVMPLGLGVFSSPVKAKHTTKKKH
jgi:hypothetical protein